MGGAAEPPIVSKCMIWIEQEACVKQITQIGTSACGATAVINVIVRHIVHKFISFYKAVYVHACVV